MIWVPLPHETKQDSFVGGGEWSNIHDPSTIIQRNPNVWAG